MAYSLTLPNGAVINNIPDNISRNQAMDMLKEKMPDAFPQPPGVLSQLVRSPIEIGKGFIRGLTTDPLSGISSLAYTGARAAGAELTPFEQTAFGRGLGEAQTALAPSDTGMITQLAGGLGSLASFIPGGLLKGGIRLATLGTQAAGLGSEEARARAEQARLEGKEVTPEQQFISQVGGTGIGLTELAPVANLIRPIEAVLRGVKRSDADAIAPGLFNSARRILETGGIEAFQEGMANILQDLVQKGVYDPNLEVGESALGDAAMGGAVGSFAQGAIELVTRGKRRDIYERLKAQEREQELQDRLARLQSEEQEQIARTKANLGVPEETLLALPAPAAPVIDAPTQDPLANPLGNFSIDELTTGISDFINAKRKRDGQSILDSFSIEDIADAGAPQAEIDRIIAGKLSQQGVNVEEGLAQNPSEQDVRNLAESKGISTDTPGYRHFLSRTTGVEDYGSMSPMQRLAAFTSLQNVEEGGILPLGTNAKRFTEQQYDKVKTSIPDLFKDSDTLSPTSVVEKVKKMTGLKSDRDARSLLDTAIRNGELSTAATPVYEVIKDGVILRKYNTRKAAAEAADRLNATIRNSTVTEFALPGTLKELPGGPDIRAGRFEAGVEPAGFDIKDATGKTLGGAATQAEAEAKATRFAATRQGEANRLQEEIQKIKEGVAGTQQRLEAMEATGQAGTVGFTKLQADAFAQAKEAQRKIEELSAQQAALAEPLSINSKGTRPVSREGYTFFQDGQPRGTFPTKEAAEEAAIQSYDDSFLERIANSGDQQRGLMPKRLAAMARNELARRRGELPQGFGIQYTGTPEEAEAKLSQAGVFTAKTQEQIRELEKKLLPAMKKLGLENVGLRIIKAIESGQGSADGFYASRLITIALDAVDPMGTLRHESIHALKNLGAFKPNEWKVLEKKAKEEWIDRFLKDRFTAQGVSLFDAYKAIYEQDNGSLAGFDEYITEEAIADAFKYFNQTKPPAGLIANLMYRLKRFFSALENAFKGLGFQTAEDVFTRTEEGGLQPIRAEGAAPSAERFQLREGRPKSFKPSEIVSSVIRDLNLSDAEVAATSLGMQTGRGGTKAFRSNDVGGIKDIVQFLEDRYAASGMPKLDINNEADRQTLSKLLAAEVLSAVRSSGANLQWYDRVIDQMLGMASLKYPELRDDPNSQAAFRIAISVASQGQNVEDNLNFGERVYEQFSQNAARGTPRFPEIGTGESMKAMQNNFRIANQMIEKMGMDNFRKFLETPFTVAELNSAGLDITGELADEQVLGSSVFGPKIGFGFYSNLSGNFEPVTMDMWFMRTIGRLTGKLKSFDAQKYANQVQRFRMSFGQFGTNGIYSNQFSQEEITNAIVDEQSMIELARKVKSLHEKDFKKNRDLFDSGQREKTDFVKSAENIIKSLDSPKDAPATGLERRLLRDVVKKMRERIAEVTGQDIPPASLQAVIWYPEQELYKALGAKLRVTSQNYANSMRKLLEGEGFDGRRISQSAQLGSRRARREAAREVSAGIEPADRRAGRALSPEERESFLETGRREVFFQKELESPKARRVIFEVAPNPDDAQTTANWNQLSTQQKFQASKEVIEKILPEAMNAVGVEGYLVDQIGSYQNDTNPSFVLFLKRGTVDQLQEIAKMLGFVLRQKEVVVASPKPVPGIPKNGAVRIEVGDISLAEADRIYQELRNIRVDGEQILDGQSTLHGNMVVLNFSKLSNVDFATTIHDQLKGDYNVVVDELYSDLIGEQDYNYGDPNSDPRGNRGVLRQRSRALRAQASQYVQDAVQKAQRGSFSLRVGPSEFVGGPSPDGGLVLGTKQPGAKSFTGIHYGKQQVNTLAGSRYGTGIKGQEAARLAESKDPRIKKRVYFYIPFPQGMMPPVEAGLGNYVHRQRFGNILPPGDEMTRLYNASEGDYNRFESSVIDAGYDGYAVPNMGMMVIMNHDVPVDYLGTRQELKGTVNLLGNQYSLRAVNTPEFKQWFGSSTITNPDGSPKVMYHGTARDIGTFKPKRADAIFVTDRPSFAESFSDESEYYMTNEYMDSATPEQTSAIIEKAIAKGLKDKDILPSAAASLRGMTLREASRTVGVGDYIRELVKNELPSNQNIMPLYVRAENPFDYENPQHIRRLGIAGIDDDVLLEEISEGNWEAIESPEVQEVIRDLFDSFYINEGGLKNLAVYDPNQVKSAVGNIGAFSRTNNDIRYSLALAGINPQSSLVPDEGGDYLGRLGMQPQKLGGRPINLLIGTHNDLIDELKNEKMYRPVSYGANHILNRVLNNPRRDPGGAQELLERIVRKAQQIARNYSRVYKEGNKLIFFAGNDSLITMEDGSIVTMYRQFDPERKYGNPIWFGRAPAVTDSKPPKGLPVRERDGLVSPKDIETAEKVKRVYTPMDVEELSAAYVEPKKGTLGLKKTAYSLSENKDPAYHSGNLRYGRDTTLGKMTGGRSTGHFGTGVYFLSKPPKPPTSERAKLLNIRADRPVQAVDFSEFKLLTPSAEFEAENLHKALRFANDLVDAKFDFKDLEAPSPTRDTKGISLGRAINRAVDDIQLAANSTRNLKKLGRDEFSKQEIRQAFVDGVNEAQSLIDQYRYGSDYVDSASTRVIKKLGFDGIDVRGLDKFDNTEYGSVIYAEEVAPAQQPRYSLRESIDPTVVNAIDRTTTTRKEEGFGDRMAEAISPTGFTKFRQGFINKYERIAQISRTVAKKFGDQELLADQSAIAAALMSDRASGVAAEAFKRGIPVYDKGYTYVTDMEGQQKGLMQILMPLAERGDPFVYQAFQFYAASKRGKRLDAEGRERLFTPDDMKKAALLEREFPEFKQVFDEYQKFNKGLVDYMKDTGVIDAEMARKWTENWDYIPFYRQLDGERTAGPNIFQSIAGVALPKKLKGGEAPLADFLETITRNTRAAIEAGMKNVAANRVVRDMKRLNDPGGTAPMIEEIKPGQRLGPDSITVRENGKTKNYRVADPLLIESLKGLNIPQLPFLEVLAKPAQVLRELVTKDPGFMMANLLRDSLQAWGIGNQIFPVVDTFKQYAKVLANMSPEAQKLMRAGIGTGYEFKGDVQATTAEFARQLRIAAGQRTAGEKAALPLTKAWDLLDQASTASDLATRAEVFKRTMQETNGNEAEAVFQAMEVMNFSRKGSNPIIQIAAAAIPFLNARIQGLDVLYRAGTGQLSARNAAARQKAFFVRGMTMMALSSLYWMLASETEEWQTAEQETRDNYWIIGPVRIPIPFELGVMFKVAPERILEYTFGDDTTKDLKMSFVRNLTSTLAVNPIPQAILPIVENVANYSFFTGQPIVGRGLEDVAKPFQVNTGTSLFASKAGESLGLSPVQIDNLIRGYTGTLGGYAVMALDAVMRGQGDPTKATMGAEQLPVVKRFFASPESTGTVTQFYELKNKLDETTRTINFLERAGKFDQMAEYMKENAMMVSMTPYIRTLEKEMNMLRDTKRVVNNSQMEPDQKREVLDAIRSAEVNMTRNIQSVRKLVD